jgi:hypothetical protein
MKTGDTRAWVSQRTAMLIGGFGLLLMAILAPIAQFGVLQGLIVDGNAETTAHNIAASQGSFVFAVVALLLVAVLDVVVALALYVVFAPTNRLLSGLAAVLRIVYGAMFVLAILHLVSVASMAGGAKADPTSVMTSVDAFQSGWDTALVVFGLHLLVLGVVVVQAGAGRRIIGILVILSAVGYLVDGVGRILVSDYSLTVATFTFIGEVVLMIWLLWNGFRGGPAPTAESTA